MATRGASRQSAFAARRSRPPATDRRRLTGPRYGAEPLMIAIVPGARMRESRQSASAREPSTRRQRFATDLVLPSHVLLRHRILFALTVAVPILLGVMAAVAPDILSRLDRPMSRALHNEAWVGFFRFVTEIGRPWAVAAISVVAGLLLLRRCRAFATALPATALTALVFDVVLKAIIDRPRPPFGIGATAAPTSFPSGHVILGVIVLGLLVPVAYLLSRRRWVYRAAVAVAAVYIPIVMVSRIAIGAHWFTDVVGSFFIGVLFLLGAELLVASRLAGEHCDCRLHGG